MRLTLRTMLAYLDDLLDPADRDDIAQKISESQFARGLMQRLEQCSRQSRLGAPHLTDKRLGVDPNIVSGYVDNTLGAERVPEFEKLCLESDVQLAEVAACHQILALVLGRPADIDPALKRRLYRIINEA